jgi:hypothetical protein
LSAVQKLLPLIAGFFLWKKGFGGLVGLLLYIKATKKHYSSSSLCRDKCLGD